MKSPAQSRNRTGTIVPLLALFIVALFGFLALAIDLGMLAVARTECQDAADAAALAGCRQLNNKVGVSNNNKATALTTSQDTVKNNVLLNANFKDANIQSVDIGIYDYNTSSQTFVPNFTVSSPPTGKSWSAVRVNVTASQPMSFAKVFGVSSMPTGATATAVHRPRDIAVVLDFSASMRFGSMTHWETGYSGSSGEVRGLMNPDPNYPRFGHYARYDSYQLTTPTTTAATSTTVASRSNPLRMTQPHRTGADDVIAPNNHTVETPGGPPMVFDFRFDPQNLADPSVKVTTSNPANFRNAFHRWFQQTPTDNPPSGMDPADKTNVFKYSNMNPSVTSAVDNGTYTARTFNWTGYDAFDTTNTNGPVPAPDNFADQSDSPITYVGDKYPKKSGASSTTWDPTSSSGPAKNAAELLGLTSVYLRRSSGTTITPPSTSPSALLWQPLTYTFPAKVTTSPATWGDGGSATTNFVDNVWEKLGYDLNVSTYVTSNYANASLKSVASGKKSVFNGYSMGPGYWGKTFFIWPPDPRFGVQNRNGTTTTSPNLTSPDSNNPAFDTSGVPMCDWRRRFFLKADGTAFNPETDNNTSASGTQSINETLLNASAGAVLADSTQFKINYPAVLAWLKTGPQVLPPNLRAGRILYYSSIPNNVTDLTDLDQRFWREYIDYVLGYTNNTSYTPSNSLAGVEYNPWPEGSTLSIGTTANYTFSISSVNYTNPKPYMNYSDNPNRPRAHFWFGPQSMIAFLTTRSPSLKNWNPGTSHEAQCWQLKSAINSALEDIRVNHPNDSCGLCYFANFNFSTPRVPLGQDWSTLKNALFYPYSMLGTIKGGDTTTELRPYDSNFSSSLVGNLPNANGGTDPITGFALAFNVLSSSSSLSGSTTPNGQNGGTGRRGASKIVIYETDGVPNGTPSWTLTGAGPDTRYQNSGSNETWSNPKSLDVSGLNSAALQSLAVIQRIVAPTSTSGTSGFSLPSSPARVYAIGFGDLFQGYDGTNTWSGPTTATNGIKFLLRSAQAGGTLSSNSSQTLPTAFVITGSYKTRITNLRDTMQRIMQSGVQVTLIE